MTRGRPAIGIGLATTSLLWLATGHAHQPASTESRGLVRVDVSVTRDQTPVPDLNAEHFTVFDNGVKQKLEQARNEQVPLEVFLVLDVSASVAEGPKLEQLKTAVRALVGGLTPRDKVALVTTMFRGKPAVRQPLTADFDAFARSLNEVDAGGPTALYDATWLALTLRQPSDARAVVIVFTDGVDNVSDTPEDRVVGAAGQSDVIVYAVTVRSSSWIPLFGRFPRDLAEATGGRVLDAEFGGRLEDAFLAVLADVRGRYLLTYYPERHAPGWHRLKVTLNGVKGNVLARRRYFVAATSKRR